MAASRMGWWGWAGGGHGAAVRVDDQGHAARAHAAYLPPRAPLPPAPPLPLLEEPDGELFERDHAHHEAGLPPGALRALERLPALHGVYCLVNNLRLSCD